MELRSANNPKPDLKPENILMDDELYPKIADFGLSKTLHQNQNSILYQSGSAFKGTLIYSSPESILNSNYTNAGDVYSFSMIAYEIITNKKPFDDYSFAKFNSAISNEKRPEFDSTILKAYKNLIERCWSQKPSDRPTFDEIVNDIATDPEFITELVDENEFLDYVDYINNCKTTFQSEKSIISIDEFK